MQLSWCVVMGVSVGLVGCGDNRLAPDSGVVDAPVGRDAALDAAPDAAPDALVPAALRLSETSVDLGPQPSGEIADHDVVVTNESSGALTFALATTGPLTASGCAASVPAGASCTAALHIAPTALGALTGTLVVTAGSDTATDAVTATAESYIEAQVVGSGQVTATPASTGCTDCYAAGGTVTLTATPDAGNHFVGWSDASCTGDTCAYTPSVTPISVTATFGPDPIALDVEITGSGAGDVVVYTADSYPGPIGQCSASCTVTVPAGEAPFVVASTPDSFGGFASPCPAGDAVCDLAVGTTTVSARFDLAPGEVDVPIATTIQTVDFDPAGELVVGGAQVVVLTSTYAPKWTAAFAGPARFAANGDVLVVTASAVVKLAAADGAVLWTHPTTALFARFYGTAHTMAATPAGGVVLDHGATVELWDPTGTTVTDLAVDSTADCVGTAADGHIYVGVDSPDFPDTEVFYEAFTAAGARELPDFTGAAGDGVENEGCDSIGAGATRLVVSTKQEESDGVGFVQLALDRSVLGEVDIDYALDPNDPAGNAVATNGSDAIALFHEVPDRHALTGLGLGKYDAARTLLWSVDRELTDDVDSVFANGVDFRDMAMASDGRVAVGVAYHAESSGSTLSPNVVEVFAP